MILLLILILQPLPDDFSPVDCLLDSLQYNSIYPDPFPEDVLIMLEDEDTSTCIDSDDHYFDFVLRENHKPGGPGDPNTSPVIDRFRVYSDGTILWFSPLPGMYIAWEDFLAGVTGL